MMNLKAIRNEALKIKGESVIGIVKDLLPGALRSAVEENPHIPEIFIHKYKFVRNGVRVGIDDGGDIVATLPDGVNIAGVFTWLNSDPFFVGLVIENQASYIKITL